MYGFGFKTCIVVAALTSIACAPVKPTATDYKERLSTGTPAGVKPTDGNKQPTPGTGPATGNSGTPPAASGNAQNGLAILTANCETAGCHKDNGITLTKTSTINDATAAKAAHRGVQPVFSATNVNDIKAALANR